MNMIAFTKMLARFEIAAAMALFAAGAFAQFTPTISQSGGPSGTVFPGTQFTVAATVSSAGPTPTGNLLFQQTDGSGNAQANYCQPNLVNGSASCTFVAPGNGNYRLRLIYSGDSNTASAFQDFPYTSQQATPAIVENGGPAGTVLPGTTFTVTAAVLSSGPTPTGNLLFQQTDGGGNAQVNYCQPNLVNGNASCTFVAPNNGNYRLRLIYSGDTPTAGGFQDFAYTTQQATPTITQSGGPSGGVLPGTTFTVTATVQSPGPTPTGNLLFQQTDGGGNAQVNYCQPNLVNGSASCTFVAPNNGNYRLRLIYSGDTPTAGGFQDFPYTTLFAAPLISQTGGPSGTVTPGTVYTVSATVASPGPTPTGNVLFQQTDGSGNAQVNYCQPNLSNGVASCTFVAPANGNYRLRLIYSGDVFTAGGFQDFPYTSLQATPTITQVGGPSGTVPPGTVFAVTATVATSGPTPTGNVLFQQTDGSGNAQVNYCQPNLVNGSASCTFVAPGNGNYRLRLIYSGDAPTAGGFQDFSYTTQQVTPTITQSGGPSGTVAPGTTFTVTATVLGAGPTPTGNLLFQQTDGSGNAQANYCQPNLVNGSASCTFVAPGNGNYRLRLIYSGDTPTASGFQDFVYTTQQVTPAIVQTGAPAGTVLQGSSFTVVATVSSPGPTPTGNVLFQQTDASGNAQVNYCQPNLVNGSASCTFTAPAPDRTGCASSTRVTHRPRGRSRISRTRRAAAERRRRRRSRRRRSRNRAALPAPCFRARRSR
jgi:hypothetical protein